MYFNQSTGSPLANSKESRVVKETEPSVIQSNRKNCPISIEELGNSTWNLLHTMAVMFPESPTEEDMKNARQFVMSLAYLYPCSLCAVCVNVIPCNCNVYITSSRMEWFMQL